MVTLKQDEAEWELISQGRSFKRTKALVGAAWNAKAGHSLVHEGLPLAASSGVSFGLDCPPLLQDG